MPEYGYMDEYNEWVSEGEVTVTDNRLTMPATSCVRLLLEGAPVGHLVNPSFDNDYTGWTVSYEGTANPKISTVVKPQDSSSPLIAGGQPHLQVWGIDATGYIAQSIESLPDGKYDIGVTVCSAGDVSITLFAGDGETPITSDGRYTVSPTVVDGRLRLGLSFSGKAGAIIDVDDFALSKSDVTEVHLVKHERRETPVRDGACFDIVIDMGRERAVYGFLATPRMDGSANGLIRKYEFHTSIDGSTWTKVSGGDWLPYCT